MRSATAPEVPKRSADGISNRDSLTGDRGFESTSLQRRVSCEPEDDIDLCASSQYRYPSSKKDAGVDDHRHRQGCGWQTRDRETLPSRTDKMGECPAPRLRANSLSAKSFQVTPVKLSSRRSEAPEN